MRDVYAELGTMPAQEISNLTSALEGAFAEGVELGPRGAHIRSLGQSLDITIAALRTALIELGEPSGAAEISALLDKLAPIARAARSYGQ